MGSLRTDYFRAVIAMVYSREKKDKPTVNTEQPAQRR